MNLDKYEKIDGREAFKRLLDNETIFDGSGDKYFIDKSCGKSCLWIESGFHRAMVDLRFNEVLTSHWYIPKPFDVRQAMLDRPNEWVGAFEVEGNWYKVGFDVKRMRPVRAFIKSETKVNLLNGGVFVIELEDLDDCIPIKDVPEEATQ